MRDETQKNYAKRLVMIGMSLLPIGFVGMAYNSGRSSIHRITDELSAQLDTVTARVDAARDGGRRPEAVDTVSADIEETERTLANLKQAHDNPLSAAALTACSVLGIAGSFCLTCRAESAIFVTHGTQRTTTKCARQRVRRFGVCLKFCASPR